MKKKKVRQSFIRLLFNRSQISFPDIPRKRLEEEELEVYGTGEKTSVQLTSFTFEVCDSVQNIAPVGFMTIGERVAEDYVQPDNDAEPKIELEVVTSSGRGKNGALCVLQSTIKPQIITSFPLSGIIRSNIFFVRNFVRI